MIMLSIAHLKTFSLFSLLLLIVSCQDAVAQNIAVTASVSAAKAGLNDQIQVTYTVETGEGSDIFRNGASIYTSAALKDFKILGGPFRSTNSNIQVIGNQIIRSSSTSISFIVQAKHLGVIKMAPAEISDNAGHTYRSNQVQIEIVNGSLAAPRGRSVSPWDDDPFFGGDPFAAVRQQQARMQQMMAGRGSQRAQQQQARPAEKFDLGKDLFIRVNVDKTSVKMGEQITAIYKLYSRIPMQVAISKLPSLNGFWNQDFDIPKNQKPVDEVVDGKHYQVFVLKKSALFPQQAGSLVLDAAEASGVAHVPAQSNGGNPNDPFAAFGSLMMNDPFFSDPFGGTQFEEKQVHLKSTPIKIQVSELPESGKPANFGGAVGQFKLAAELDHKELTTDQVATLKLTVSGSGNLKLFEAPKLLLPDGLDSYDPDVLDTITGRTTTISGQKIITYSIAPRKTGRFDIPPITLHWYNPQTGKYESASTSGYTVDVRAGKNPIVVSTQKGSARADIIDHFQPKTSGAMILSPVYWSMYALPLLLFVFVVAYRRKQDQDSADLGKLRIRQANKVALKRLARAGALLQKNDPRGFYDEISKAIWLYLSDKLNIPISALGKEAALQALGNHGVPSSIQQQIEKVLGECELALYASSYNSQEMQQTFSEAACIITGLERTLRAS